MYTHGAASDCALTVFLTRTAWSVYGRTEPAAQLCRIVETGSWFFCRIEGRRRIGKTSLLGAMAKHDGAFADRLVDLVYYAESLGSAPTATREA